MSLQASFLRVYKMEISMKVFMNFLLFIFVCLPDTIFIFSSLLIFFSVFFPVSLSMYFRMKLIGRFFFN